jgi:hypothetical protein
MKFRYSFFQNGSVNFFGTIVQTNEANFMGLSKMFYLMENAELVSLFQRIWNALGEHYEFHLLGRDLIK